MSLGLAKDSMLNLAELAASQKVDESTATTTTATGTGDDEKVKVLHDSSKLLSLEDASEEALVMRLSTHEIMENVESLEEAEVQGQETTTATFTTVVSTEGVTASSSNDTKTATSSHQKQDVSNGNVPVPSLPENGTLGLSIDTAPTIRISSNAATITHQKKNKKNYNRIDSDTLSEASETPSELSDKIKVTETTATAATSSSAATSPSPSKVSPSSYGAYSGFHHDYSDYENYGDYNLAGTPMMILGPKSPLHESSRGQREPFWCCLFPWINYSSANSALPPSEYSEEATPQESLVHVNGSGNGNGTKDTAMQKQKQKQDSGTSSDDNDEDETSTVGSDVFGEKLSDKDRQAVLARLRLASPDVASSSETDESGSGLLNGLNSMEGSDNMSRPITTPKSILKQTSSLTSRTNLQLGGGGANAASGGASAEAKRRRSLFPSYETKKKSNKNLHTEFSPMARVLTVKSHKDMDGEEKSAIWWQRSDYEEFRKTGRMITRVMLQGGSEVWLATNQSWQTPNKDRQTTLKHAFSLAERQAAFHKGDVNAKKEYEDTRDKWWHKFGHSRRGLEHIASIDEGRQRQTNVKTAIRAVVEEQRRQKVFNREDPDKLRMVSLQHTSWARDLSMAAGASDADAVRMNFDDISRKSREFYLLKFSRSNQMTVTNTKKANVPAFMKPALSMKTVQPSRLDANTVSQIRFRQGAHKKRSAVAPITRAESVPIKSESEATASDSKMAKQAAGFASGEEVGNMSAVLTGMGPIPVAGQS